VRCCSLHSLCEGPLTGAFFGPPLAKKAETPSIIAARLSSKPMLAGLVRAELKEATGRGVCKGITKALHERTEATTRKTRNIRGLLSASIACPIAIIPLADETGGGLQRTQGRQ